MSEVRINNKKEFRDAVQDYLALRLIEKQINKTREDLAQLIKKAWSQFHFKTGQAIEFDGPNGGVTLVKIINKEFFPEGIKNHFGQQIYDITTETVVKTVSKDLIIQMVKMQLEGGLISKEDADKIYKEVDETQKILSVFGRKPKGTMPQIPFRDSESGYQPISPHIMEELNIEELMKEEDNDKLGLDT